MSWFSKRNKVKKLFSHSKGRQIWRIMLSNLGHLILEERDLSAKKVYFSCFNYSSGKSYWIDKQFLSEDFWIGIETVQDDILVLHKFEKPDFPTHKGIIAVDLNTGSLLWNNNELVFDFIDDDKIYASKTKFESREFFILKCKTGEVISSVGNDVQLINEIRELVDEESKYAAYLFPTQLSNEENFQEESKLVLRTIGDTKYLGYVEFINFASLFIFNCYEKIIDSSLVNKLYIYDKSSQKILFSEVLNQSTPAPIPDSFFIYEDILYFIKNKNEIVALKLISN
ncbi:MAG: DUF4905 domain-containing protein [Ignavibacteria bacterium]|nr:DUF4905 domain-containing protein [Ignavibacteria bacterium]